MLERKRIEHEVVDLLPGFHPVQLRTAGFRGGTVPALRIQGRRIRGSRSISRALEALQSDPPLFPAEPGRAPVADRPAGELAMRVLPRYPGPIPSSLPAEWLAPLGAGS
jgi:glutathione S-transferase